jgi:hypothetical protein
MNNLSDMEHKETDTTNWPTMAFDKDIRATYKPKVSSKCIHSSITLGMSKRVSYKAPSGPIEPPKKPPKKPSKAPADSIKALMTKFEPIK